MLGDYPGRVHNVYIGFATEYVEGHPQPDEVEVDGADFFSFEEMKSMDVADMTRELARISFEQQAVGLKLNPLPKTIFNGYTFVNV